MKEQVSRAEMEYALEIIIRFFSVGAWNLGRKVLDLAILAFYILTIEIPDFILRVPIWGRYAWIWIRWHIIPVLAGAASKVWGAAYQEALAMGKELKALWIERDAMIQEWKVA